MMMGPDAKGIRRIWSELRKIWVDPPPFCRPGASPMTDLLHLEVVIDGPDGTPYAGGTFPVDIDLADMYPLRPPKITFKTKVYHPNINSDGKMTLGFLHSDWSQATTIEGILIYIVFVLRDPTFDGRRRSNYEASDVYESDIELYEQLATAWTWEYSAPIVSYYPTEEDEPRLNRLAAVAARRAADEEEQRRRRYEEAERRRRQEDEEEMKRRAVACQCDVETGGSVSSGMVRRVTICYL